MGSNAPMLVGLLALVAVAGSPASADPPRLAVLPIELDDTSGEPPNPDQARRLRMLDDQLLARLAESGRFAPVPTSLPDGSPAIRNCNACEVAAAERVGAALVLTGVVHKVSNLILDLELVVKDVPRGTPQAVWRADFRGNTDESWSHALRWLLRNRLLAEPPPR